MMLESDLARIRGIDGSAFGTLRKDRERQLTKEARLTPIEKGGQAFVFYAAEEMKRVVEVNSSKMAALLRRSGDQIFVSRVIRYDFNKFICDAIFSFAHKIKYTALQFEL